jgi:tRNA (cytidine/uridine-2'-O-)-methyltransferase
MRVHASWEDCMRGFGDARRFALTRRAARRYDDVRYREGDVLVFGAETSGLPDDVLAQFAPEQQLRLPMRPGNRSLNLSNSVAVVVFEAWRQAGFAGAEGGS